MTRLKAILCILTVYVMVMSQPIWASTAVCEKILMYDDNYLAYLAKDLEEIHLNLALMELVHSHAQMLVERYPPEKYKILNWGLSNVLISGFIKEILPEDIYKEYVIDLPMQGRHFYFRDQLKEEKERLQFFKKLLPQLDDLKGKELVFHRGIMSGGQSYDVIPTLLEYLDSIDSSYLLHFHFVTGYFEDSSHGDGTGPVESSQDHPKTGSWEITHNHILARGLINRGALDGESYHFNSSVKPFRITDVLHPKFDFEPNSHKARQLSNLIKRYLELTEVLP